MSPRPALILLVAVPAVAILASMTVASWKDSRWFGVLCLWGLASWLAAFVWVANKAAEAA